jgi:hypothetical protein
MSKVPSVVVAVCLLQLVHEMLGMLLMLLEELEAGFQ